MKFAVAGLPRSRTKWASVFLSTPDCPVLHDTHPDTFKDACAVSSPLVISHYDRIPEGTKIAYIDRPFSEVFESSEVFGMGDAAAELELYKHELFKDRKVKVFDFHNLDAAALWKFCHGTEISKEYIKVFDDMNIVQKQMDTFRGVS